MSEIITNQMYMLHVAQIFLREVKCDQLSHNKISWFKLLKEHFPDIIGNWNGEDTIYSKKKNTNRDLLHAMLLYVPNLLQQRIDKLFHDQQKLNGVEDAYLRPTINVTLSEYTITMVDNFITFFGEYIMVNS